MAVLGHLVGSSHGGILWQCPEGGSCWSPVLDALWEVTKLYIIFNVILKLLLPKAGILFAYTLLSVNGNWLFCRTWCRYCASDFFPEHLFVYVSSGVTNRIYQACTYLHVQTRMQALMDTHAFVSLILAFVVTALWGPDIEVGSVVSCEIRKVVNCPQMVIP